MRKVGWTEGKETDALVFEGRNSSKGRCREATLDIVKTGSSRPDWGHHTLGLASQVVPSLQYILIQVKLRHGIHCRTY